MAQTAAAIGIHSFWGLSSAFDCSDAFAHVLAPDEKPAEAAAPMYSAPSASDGEDILRVLLVQPGDMRHVMATVSKRLRQRLCSENSPAVHFYVIESPLEVLARNLLLWEAFLDFEIPIRQRANLFLEMYGNSKVQDRTSRYMERLGQRLRSLVSDGASTLNLIDLSYLKYRDKDELESIFKSYSRQTVFDADGLRNQRMRGYYAERYDSRRALYDWDYQYGIHDCASLIHMKLFRDWRESGVAFEFGDQIYSEPNRTLMSYTEGVMKRGAEKGMKKEIRGFWGDIVCSPYFGFGIDCETPGKFEEGLFEIMNKGTGTEQHRHHCVEVAVYSLLAMMWEVETGRQYKMTRAHDIYSGLGSESNCGNGETSATSNGTIEEEDIDAVVDGQPETAESEATSSPHRKEKSVQPVDLKDSLQRKQEDLIAREIARAEAVVSTFDGVKVFPLHGDPSMILDKAQYENLFDVMFVSARSANFLSTTVADKILKTGNAKGAALVAVETGKHLVPLLKKSKSEFLQKERSFCLDQMWTELRDPPVFRRHRDAQDKDDDVIFFAKYASEAV